MKYQFLTFVCVCFSLVATIAVAKDRKSTSTAISKSALCRIFNENGTTIGEKVVTIVDALDGNGEEVTATTDLNTRVGVSVYSSVDSSDPVRSYELKITEDGRVATYIRGQNLNMKEQFDFYKGARRNFTVRCSK